MADLLLFDSDVLIDYLRGVPKAVTFVQGSPEQKAMSAVTVAELYSGVREGEERTKLDNLVRAFNVVVVSPPLGIQGGLIRREYYPSHGTGLADAIIAATAKARGATLVTLNEKHFSMLDDVVVPYRKN